MLIECHYTDPPHTHEYPDDWVFGGADGLDPRADVRWKPTTYTYISEDLVELHVTQAPLCDDQALDEFTLVRDWFRGKAKPHWLWVKRPDSKIEALPWTYDSDTDMLNEVRKNAQGS